MIWDLSCSNFHSYRRSMCIDHLHNVNPSCNAVWLTSNSTTNPNSQYTFSGVNAGTKIATVQQDLKLSIFLSVTAYTASSAIARHLLLLLSLFHFCLFAIKKRIAEEFNFQFTSQSIIRRCGSILIDSINRTINMYSLIGVFTVSQMNYFWQTMSLFSVNLKSLYHNSNSIYEYLCLPRCIKHAKNKCTYR